MAEIIIHMGDELESSDLTRLRNSLKHVGPRDKITIRLEAADAHQADQITYELERQGFDYQPHGGHGKDFYFTAYKRLH